MADSITTTTTTNGITSMNGHALAQSAIRPLTWLITGTSSGFGYRLTLLALNRGDRVLATARSLPKLQTLVDEVARDADQSKKERLKTFRLDLGDSEEVVRGVVDEAAKVWGSVDVLVNNAGTCGLDVIVGCMLD